MTPQEQTSIVPPYVPYRTFQTFLEFLFDEGMPDRIDRTVWGSRFSGSSGTQLMTALKVLSLIDTNGRPGQDLNDLVYAEGDARRSTLREVLERFYTPLFKLDLARASKGQFHEAFRSFGTKEGVLTKCEAFFIRAAQSAGIEISKRILVGRHGANRGRNVPVLSRSRTSSTQSGASGKIAAPVSMDGDSSGISMKLQLADRILSKYPDFDPAWDPAVQAKWLEGMTRLYDGLSTSAVGREDDSEDALANA